MLQLIGNFQEHTNEAWTLKHKMMKFSPFNGRLRKRAEAFDKGQTFINNHQSMPVMSNFHRRQFSSVAAILSSPIRPPFRQFSINFGLNLLIFQWPKQTEEATPKNDANLWMSESSSVAAHYKCFCYFRYSRAPLCFVLSPAFPRLCLLRG